jgi:hypothetical protein
VIFMETFSVAPDVGEEIDDVSTAPESGQPPGGPEDPWEGEDAAGEVDFPPAHHASPNEEL